jgi:hypothetical protein
MSETQRVAFSLGRERPPYLLGFEGSVAERHVENLKIMRSVGGRRYVEGCKELSAEEILLRQTVYNLYSGPGMPPALRWADEIVFIGLWGGRLRG